MINTSVLDFEWLHRACFYIQLHRDKAFNDQNGVGFEDCGLIEIIPAVKEWNQKSQSRIYYSRGMIEAMIEDFLICAHYDEINGESAGLTFACVEDLGLLSKMNKPEWPGSELHCEQWYRFKEATRSRELNEMLGLDRTAEHLASCLNVVKFTQEAVRLTKP